MLCNAQDRRSHAQWDRSSSHRTTDFDSAIFSILRFDIFYLRYQNQACTPDSFHAKTIGERKFELNGFRLSVRETATTVVQICLKREFSTKIVCHKSPGHDTKWGIFLQKAL
jgi:hypothetical protein